MISSFGLVLLSRRSLTGIDRVPVPQHLYQSATSICRFDRHLRRSCTWGHRRPYRRGPSWISSKIVGLEKLFAAMCRSRVRFQRLPGFQLGYINATPHELSKKTKKSPHAELSRYANKKAVLLQNVLKFPPRASGHNAAAHFVQRWVLRNETLTLRSTIQSGAIEETVPSRCLGRCANEAKADPSRWKPAHAKPKRKSKRARFWRRTPPGLGGVMGMEVFEGRARTSRRPRLAASLPQRDPGSVQIRRTQYDVAD